MLSIVNCRFAWFGNVKLLILVLKLLKSERVEIVICCLHCLSWSWIEEPKIWSIKQIDMSHDIENCFWPKYRVGNTTTWTSSFFPQIIVLNILIFDIALSGGKTMLSAYSLCKSGKTLGFGHWASVLCHWAPILCFWACINVNVLVVSGCKTSLNAMFHSRYRSILFQDVE